MTVAAPAHRVQWSAPEPLWETPAGDGAAPALLTLAGDRFMDDLRARLAGDPDAIEGLLAKPRSHRVRPPGRPADWEPAGAVPPLKLYGAVHGEYNLVAASLVCAAGGLPERRLRTAEGDRVVFVLRRLDAAGDEEAWVPGVPDGAWRPAAAGELVDGEDLLPMFSLEFTDRSGYARKLHVGLVPTTSVDSWSPPAPPQAPEDPAVARARRVGELQRLVETYRALARAEVWTGPVDHVANAMDAVDLWLIDLADFLMRWHPEAWALSAPGAAVPTPAPALVALLRSSTFGDATTLGARVHEAWTRREALLGEAGAARQTLALRTDGLRMGGGPLTAESLSGVLRTAVPKLDAAPSATSGVTVDPRSPRQPKLDPAGRREHVIRCAYVRPHCEPVHGPILSAPTARFRLASFFDPDAPARDVHIALPAATGVKDLRKLRKSVSVAISEQLQRQMSRVGELKDDFARKDGQDIDFGMVCSFSIPIITLCALIVLMVFVIILNLIFFWMPLLRICLPVPKGSGS